MLWMNNSITSKTAEIHLWIYLSRKITIAKV
jgi:hypothetical protein